MALAQERPYTIDDIYALPDGKRAELIDGRIYDMAPPNRKHQSLIGSLYFKIASYINAHNGSCKAYLSPFAVRLFADDYTYVEPDISVICDPKKLDDRGCTGAQDWIIELISPSTKQMDYFTKLFHYRNAGVREYWIVDADKNRVVVYRFESETTDDFTLQDVVPVGIYDDFSIDFSDIEI